MNENFSNGLQKLYNCVSKGLGSIMIPQEVRNILDMKQNKLICLKWMVELQIKQFPYVMIWSNL